MRTTLRLAFLLGLALLLNRPCIAQNNNITKTKNSMNKVLIDKITVPPAAREAFTSKMNTNRAMLKKLKGFVRDDVYERTDENNNLVYITIAVWENETLFKQAKEAVEAEYKKTGFDPRAFCISNNIIMERGIYEPVAE